MLHKNKSVASLIYLIEVFGFLVACATVTSVSNWAGFVSSLECLAMLIIALFGKTK